MSWLQYARTLRYLKPVQMYGLARNRLLQHLPAGPTAIQGARISERVQPPRVPFLPAPLIYGAGRGGQLILRELLQNPAFGLRPMGFLDDDPRLQGRVVHGVPILGSLSGLRSIIEAQSISCLVVSSHKINGNHLGQAISLCQEWHIAMLQVHLKLEPVALEPGGVDGVPHPARKV